MHEIDCRNQNEIYVGELTNWRVQKLTLHSEQAKYEISKPTVSVAFSASGDSRRQPDLFGPRSRSAFQNLWFLPIGLLHA